MPLHQAEILQRADFTWRVRVYYEDTDASGVVYHAQYLKFFERARTEWLRALGFDQERLARDLGVAFTLASAVLRFRRPARLDDQLDIVVNVTNARRASWTFAQSMRRGGNDIASGEFKAGCVSMESFKPCAIPAAVTRAIAESKASTMEHG